MPLPVSDIERELTHTRRARYEGYKRADGTWDIDGHITDHKSHDYTLATGVRRAGQPIHEMWIRIRIDRNFNILEAIAVTDAMPYAPGCADYGDTYEKLVGMNLVKGFRKQVAEKFGGTGGCTHLTEMLGGLPTAAIQTFAGEMAEDAGDTKPFQLDQCHALDTRSETVRQWYPRWHRKDAAKA